MDSALDCIDGYEAAWPELKKKAIIQRRKTAFAVLASVVVPVTLAVIGWIISILAG